MSQVPVVDAVKEAVESSVQQTVNWEAIDKLITDKQCKTGKLAAELGLSTTDMRDLLEQHYNSGEKPRIVFKVGRYGGVMWA